MRLLRVELRKLRRPLLYWTVVGVVVVSALLLWLGQVNSIVYNPPPGALPVIRETPTTCYRLPPGPECDKHLEAMRAAMERDLQLARAGSRLAKAGQQPLGVGRFPAGLVASLVGAGAVLLLAAGHVGGEWSGRTIKSILIQDGRRGRLLAAKVVSLWLVGAALIAVTWAALAALSPYLAHKYGNSTVKLPVGEAALTALSQTARALLVLAVFSVLGVAAAVLTRNMLGTFALSFGMVLLSQALFDIPAFTRWTPAYWVTGWMRFQAGNLPGDYLWRVQLPPGVPTPTAWFGLVGLLFFLALSAAVAWLTFSRSDVTG